MTTLKKIIAALTLLILFSLLLIVEYHTRTLRLAIINNTQINSNHWILLPVNPKSEKISQ